VCQQGTYASRIEEHQSKKVCKMAQKGVEKCDIYIEEHSTHKRCCSFSKATKTAMVNIGIRISVRKYVM
jgi:hypothetical protein